MGASGQLFQMVICVHYSTHLPWGIDAFHKKCKWYITRLYRANVIPATTVAIVASVTTVPAAIAMTVVPVDPIANTISATFAVIIFAMMRTSHVGSHIDHSNTATAAAEMMISTKYWSNVSLLPHLYQLHTCYGVEWNVGGILKANNDLLKHKKNLNPYFKNFHYYTKQQNVIAIESEYAHYPHYQRNVWAAVSTTGRHQPPDVSMEVC